MAAQSGALCMACSSSPSPKAQLSVPFTTPCCARSICERCLTRNPRLRGYNPCLACFAGVAVVDQSRAFGDKLNWRVTAPGPSGQSQDQEESMFVLGGSDDEDEPKDATEDHGVPPAYAAALEMSSSTGALSNDDIRKGTRAPDGEGTNPSRYYIQSGDTLRGIALRFGVDGRKICQLNSFPFSTLSTTPHLLHTRRWLVLPSGGLSTPAPDPGVLEAHDRERAEKRFQFVTKEVDWRIAKTYVALAEGEDDNTKSKEGIEAVKSEALRMRVLEAKAVDRFLEDEEWEAEQGGGPRLQGFPPFAHEKGKTAERVTLGSRLGRLLTRP